MLSGQYLIMLELLPYDFTESIYLIIDLFEFTYSLFSYLKNDVDYNNLFIGAYIFGLFSFINFLDD